MSALPIVERLKRYGKPITEGHPDHDGGRYTYARHVNPDGPEAAELITELYEALSGACIVLGGLTDEEAGSLGRVAYEQAMRVLAKARGQ